jgi:7-cyano-7-deazaguanine synthase
MTKTRDAALVLFSGGQDSTTCLAWALERFAEVETLGFDYGQRHAAELSARPGILAGLRSDFPRWRSLLGADHVLPLEVLRLIGGNALTGSMPGESIGMGPSGLPTSFVPGRNILFLAAAAALAYRRGIRHLVGGMCETDYSGYPDCRERTIQAVGQALNLGMEADFAIHTPLMHLDKQATWSLAEELGGRKLVDLIVEETVTCYDGDRTMRHEWGYGCENCPACRLRARGYERYVGR